MSHFTTSTGPPPVSPRPYTSPQINPTLVATPLVPTSRIQAAGTQPAGQIILQNIPQPKKVSSRPGTGTGASVVPPVAPRKPHTSPHSNQTQVATPLASASHTQATNIHPGQILMRNAILPTKNSMKREVRLIWKKQIDTINDTVTYFDKQDNPCELLWDKFKEHYSTTTHLTCGEHTGCLFISDSDSSPDMQTFSVLDNYHTSQIQSISLSVITAEVYEKGTQAVKSRSREKKKEAEEVRQLREERTKLKNDISVLNAKLEDQKKQHNSQLDECKKEIQALKQQLKAEKEARIRIEGEAAGLRNQARITELRLERDLKKVQPPLLDNNDIDNIWHIYEAGNSKNQSSDSASERSEYVNLEPVEQVQQYYVDFKKLEKSNLSLQKQKDKSEKESARFLDLLHGEKIRLEAELAHTKRQFADSETENAHLKEALTKSNPLPVPSRSQAVKSSPLPPPSRSVNSKSSL